MLGSAALLLCRCSRVWGVHAGSCLLSASMISANPISRASTPPPRVTCLESLQTQQAGPQAWLHLTAGHPSPQGGGGCPGQLGIAASTGHTYELTAGLHGGLTPGLRAQPGHGHLASPWKPLVWLPQGSTVSCVCSGCHGIPASYRGPGQELAVPSAHPAGTMLPARPEWGKSHLLGRHPAVLAMRPPQVGAMHTVHSWLRAPNCPRGLPVQSAVSVTWFSPSRAAVP